MLLNFPIILSKISQFIILQKYPIILDVLSLVTVLILKILAGVYS